MDLLKYDNLMIIAALLVLVGMVGVNSKLQTYLMNNMFDTSVLGLCLLVILVLFYTNVKRDNFQSCCNPAGSTALIRPECVGANLEDTSGCGDGGGADVAERQAGGASHLQAAALMGAMQDAITRLHAAQHLHQVLQEVHSLFGS